LQIVQWVDPEFTEVNDAEEDCFADPKAPKGLEQSRSRADCQGRKTEAIRKGEVRP
jgi:hypothetical protein